jgi:tetratricopeptide (TPR) repeat protein
MKKLLILLLFSCLLPACVRSEPKSDHIYTSARFLEHGQLEKAMEQSILAEKVEPTNCLVWINRAQIQRAMGMTNESIVSAQKAIRLSPTNVPPPYPFAINLLIEFGKMDDAQQLIIAALNDPMIQSRDIPHARVLLLQAQLYSKRGEFSKGLDSCEEALKVLPGFDKGSSAEILRQKAICLSALGKDTDAAAAKNQAMSLEGDMAREEKDIQEKLKQR